MGPLHGITVIELAGLGPAPFAGMLLADMGAEVICIDRGVNNDPMYAKDMSRRGKKSVIINLKDANGRDALLKLIEKADVLIEGFRPGVMEKLGVGPEVCQELNPKLVYGRMTGWGQTGPMAKRAGHDINYISLNGALHAIGVDGEKPVPPVNFVADFGGGAMFLIAGVLAALIESKTSGKGQVIDAAMNEGAANLLWMCHSFAASGAWDLTRRGANMLDGGAFFYDTYETADGRHMAVGAIEPQFFNLLVELCQLDTKEFNLESQLDSNHWPIKKELLAKVFKQKTQQEWADLLTDTDACCTPVLSAEEAPFHAHNQSRENYLTIDDFVQPAPAPRFNRTPSEVLHGAHKAGADTHSVLVNAGFSEEAISNLREQGAVS